MIGKEREALRLEFEVDTREKLKFQLDSLSLIAFVAVLPLYSPNIGILAGFSQFDSIIGHYIFSLFSGILLMSLATLIYTSRKPGWLCFGSKLLGMATALYLVGTLLIFALLQLSEPIQSLAVVAGLCAGFGIVPLCIAWGTHFAMPLRNALLWGAFCCVVASLLSWLLVSIPRPSLWVLYPLVMLLGALGPYVKMRRKTFRFPRVDAAVEQQLNKDAPVLDAANGLTSIFSSIRRLLSIIWLPFAGLLLYAFLTSVHKLTLFDILDSEFLGGVIAGLLIIPLCFIKNTQHILPLVYRIVVPVLVAVLIVLGSFSAGTLPQFVAMVGIYVFCVFLAMFAIASLFAVAYAGEFSPAFVYAFTLVCGTAVTLFGLVQTQVLSLLSDFTPVLWVIMSVFFAVILLNFGWEAWRDFVAPREQSAQASSTTGDLQSTCAELARRSNLSQRESEILIYLGRGYSPTYIAKVLVISVSTVRSHVRNIYKKMGIGSREELLLLLEQKQTTI